MKFGVLVLLVICMGGVLTESKEERNECGTKKQEICVSTQDECPGRINRRLRCEDRRQLCCNLGRGMSRPRNVKARATEDEESEAMRPRQGILKKACKKRPICKQIKGRCKKKSKKCKGQAFWGPELCDPSEDCNCCVKKNKLCRNRRTCDLNKGNCQFYFEPCNGIQIPNACKGKNKKACACCAACEIEKSCLKQGGVCYNSASQCIGIVVEKGCKGPDCICCVPPPLAPPVGPPGTNMSSPANASSNNITSASSRPTEPAAQMTTRLAVPDASENSAEDNPGANVTRPPLSANPDEAAIAG